MVLRRSVHELVTGHRCAEIPGFTEEERQSAEPIWVGWAYCEDYCSLRQFPLHDRMPGAKLGIDVDPG